MRLFAVVLPALITVSNAQFDIGSITGIAQGIAGLGQECVGQASQFPARVQEFMTQRKEMSASCGAFLKGNFRATLNRTSLGPGEVAGFKGLKQDFCDGECGELVESTLQFMSEQAVSYSACEELVKQAVSMAAGLSGGADIAVGAIAGAVGGGTFAMVFDTLATLRTSLCNDPCGGLTDIPCWICKGAAMATALPIDTIMGLIPAAGSLPIDVGIISDVCNLLPFCENDGGGCKRKAAYECNAKETLKVLKKSFAPLKQNCAFPLEKDTCSNAECKGALTGMQAMMGALTKGEDGKWVPGKAALCTANVAGELIKDIIGNAGDVIEETAKRVTQNVGDLVALVLEPTSLKQKAQDWKAKMRERTAAKQQKGLAECDVDLDKLEVEAEAEFAALLTKDSEVLYQALQDDKLLETSSSTGDSTDDSPSSGTGTGTDTGKESAGTIPYPVAAPLLTAAALVAVAAQ